MNFLVDLQSFRGPLDLLLYLVRKHEIDIQDIPIALITDQYLEYLDVLEQLDVDAVGDFIEMASTLIEIKSRMVLPRGGEDADGLDDPREELVQRLLEYKKYKDAASMLEEQSRQWQQRFARMAADMPPRVVDPADQPIHEVELWDLVNAVSRIIREHDAVRPSNIVYDDTPIHVYMQRIHSLLVDRRQVPLSDLFAAGMHKSAMIGLFLALLELVRHHGVRTEQNSLHGEIWIFATEDFDDTLDVSELEHADDYGPVADKEADEAPAKPR